MDVSELLDMWLVGACSPRAAKNDTDLRHVGRDFRVLRGRFTVRQKLGFLFSRAPDPEAL